MNIESVKRALVIAIQAGIGFEGDTKDATDLMNLIVGLESRIAKLKQDLVNKDIEYTDLWNEMLLQRTRLEKMNSFIETLIKIGNWAILSLRTFLGYTGDAYTHRCYDPHGAIMGWDELVDDWKESEEWTK